MHNYSKMSMIRKTILYTYALLLDQTEVEELREEFEQIDIDHTG